MKQLLSTLLIAALLLTCIPTALAAHTYDKSCLRYDEAFAFLTLLNQKRTSMGLGALSMDRELLDGASIRAYEQTISFSHTRPDGSKYSTAAPPKGTCRVPALVSAHREFNAAVRAVFFYEFSAAQSDSA